MDTKSDDAPSELVHDYEYPVAIQKNGFTPKQINAPEAVFGVPKESQPRWPIVTRVWPVMCGEDAPYHIFIDSGAKCFIDLLCDPWAAKPWIALFHFDDRPAEFGRWAFGARFSFTAS
jgi:hypothetical protein